MNIDEDQFVKSIREDSRGQSLELGTETYANQFPMELMMLGNGLS